MSPVELDVMQAELDDSIQGRVELQVAQGIALDSHRETAKASLRIRQGRDPSEGPNESRSGQRNARPQAPATRMSSAHFIRLRESSSSTGPLHSYRGNVAQGVSQATYLQDKVVDIKNACWEEELTYWKPPR